MRQFLHHENWQAIRAACIHSSNDCQAAGAAEEGRGSMVTDPGTTAEVLYGRESGIVVMLSLSKEGVRTASG